MKVTINMNETVKIKLKKSGIEKMRSDHAKLKESHPALHDFKAPKVDSDGYTEMQLHAVMNRFGEMMTLGAEMPFDIEIVIDRGIR